MVHASAPWMLVFFRILYGGKALFDVGPDSANLFGRIWPFGNLPSLIIIIVINEDGNVDRSIRSDSMKMQSIAWYSCQLCSNILLNAAFASDVHGTTCFSSREGCRMSKDQTTAATRQGSVRMNDGNDDKETEAIGPGMVGYKAIDLSEGQI